MRTNATLLIVLATMGWLISAMPSAAQRPVHRRISRGPFHREIYTRHVHQNRDEMDANDDLQTIEGDVASDDMEQIGSGTLVEESEWEAGNVVTGCDDDCQTGCTPIWHRGRYRNSAHRGLGIDHLSFFGGVQGFKNQSNRGQGASFGFHEGVNFGTYGSNVILPPTFGVQVGFSATQNDLSGANFSDVDRNQTFLTAGIFRRGDEGLQVGAVFDYLNDDWYFEDLGVSQIRGEVSMALCDRRSYGFWFTSSFQDDTKVSQLATGNVTEQWETVDLYAFFYRTRMLAQGAGEVRLYAGWTGDRDGLIGAESKIPLQNGFALESQFTYLIPDEDAGAGGSTNEAWNLGINIAWYPGSLKCGSCRRYQRPMFDVANNGSMILRQSN